MNHGSETIVQSIVLMCSTSRSLSRQQRWMQSKRDLLQLGVR